MSPLSWTLSVIEAVTMSMAKRYKHAVLYNIRDNYVRVIMVTMLLIIL